MNDTKRFEHPALDEVYTALNAIEQIEAQLKAAKRQLEEAIIALPARIGDNEDLQDEVFHHLYWFDERVNATTLKKAFQVIHPAHVKKNGKGLDHLMRSAYIEIPCIRCQQPFRITVTSRSELERQRGYIERDRAFPNGFNAGWATTCDSCKAKRDEASHQRYEQQQAEEAARIMQLRTMPYREYLQTPEWQERRKRAMKKAGFRCQVCNAYGVRLNVHHRTYERRGNENDRDLITLCEDCHTTFHENGRLAGVEA